MMQVNAGNGTYAESTIPVLVKTAEGYLTNISNISAGNKTSSATTYDGKVYVWGDNTNKQLGVSEIKIAYATQIDKIQEKNGKTIELKQMEIVEVGKNHSTISDKDGFVYTVGLNTFGQLGTEDNNNREIFTKIGELEIVSIPDETNISIGNTQEISIILRNTFNLKRDVPEDSEIELTNTNDKEISIEKIEGIDNSQVTDIQDFVPNYKITGNKIGRVNLVAKSQEEYIKNIWINVVNKDGVEVSAKVVNGNGFTITLRSDGTVWSFGNNESGQLGLGDTNSRNKPEQIKIQEEIIDISSGENHTLLLGKSGKVYSFGLNSKGQLGTGNVTTYKVPVELGITNIEKVIAKQNTSFAITEKGTVYAWGEGYTKMLTLLSITKTVETGEVDNEGNIIEKVINQNIVDISKTYYLADDGIVRRIADNEIIKLSLNEYDPSEEPVIIEERIIQISEGVDHLLLLGESGRIYTYGQNVYGGLGDGTTNSRENLITTVVRVEDGSILTNIAEISAGDKYAIAVSKDGKVYTFGINGGQQLGFNNKLEEGGIQESGYAKLKEDIFNVERVSAGYTHTAVYKEDGNVYAWGQGEDGELGNAENSNYYEPQIVGKNIIETNVTEVLIEEDQTFDIDGWINYFNLFEEKESQITYEILDGNIGIINDQTGEIMAIGEGRTTVIAKEVGTDKIAVIPLRVLKRGTEPDNIDILIEPQVQTAGSHTISLRVDGTVWCYGIGTYGELGIGNVQNSDAPVQAIFPEGTIITKIAAGEYHCLALDNDGNVWSWGRNNYYQLGNNKDNNILIPTKVSGLSNIRDIEAGYYTSFAIGETGEVYSFGLNANGEGAIGSYTNKITVSKAKYITDAIDIKAGKNHTIILKSTGEVFVAGSNLYGELGTNSSERKVNQFTKVENLDKVVSISVGDSNNTVIKVDGSVYSWGSNIYKELGTGKDSTFISEPTKVQNLKDIRYIDGGKGYNLAINNNNEVFVNGLNTSGELGNNSKTNVNTYTKLDTINNVIMMSSGNGYTMFLQSDGTVWGCGDYTHGNENIKSKTKSIVPIQVGNDQTGLGQTQITLEVDGTEGILANCAYEFNLIYMNSNFTDNLTFESLNEEIATVDEIGVITGNRVGTTRVNAISNTDGKKYSVLVNVVQTGEQNAPKVEAGENFAAVLKADGSLWTFGYNADGRLGIGNSLTKDIPTKTNILSTYKDIKAGKDFLIALREDGSVWSVGNNKMGQLGNETTNSKNKLSQIQGIEDIVKIAAGEDFAIAIDSFGIIYGWGNNKNGQIGNNNKGNILLKPTQITTSSQRIIDVAAGNSQSVLLTAKGTVLGYGNILNGTVEEIENAIKVQVTNNSIVILTANGEVYEYKNGNLEQITLPNKVIDISAKSDAIMYQTVDEKTYVSGKNAYGELGVGTTNSITTPVLVNLHGENTFAIGVGYNNTYIIENTGNVYASGNNECGSIGNGTRDNKVEHILVGNRLFKVEPETDTMNVGDVEEIKISGEPFNVFGKNEISNEEYSWNSDAETVVFVEPGNLTAKNEGTAHITITDKITNESITLTRIVIEPDSDRIAKITVNGEKATLDETSTQENIKYKVQVVTNENAGVLNITTNNLNDRISIDGGITWSYNGTLNQEIELTDKITQISIIVGVQNNTGEYPVELIYTLNVEKITDDIGLKQVTVTSTDDNGIESTLTAVPVNLTRYEVVIAEKTNISLVDVIAGSEYSFVSIDGQEYSTKEQTKNIIIGNELTKEVKIAVKSEAGTETEYTLIIYTENEVMNLSSLKVNNKEVTKVSEGVYSATVEKDTNIANIVATIQNHLAQISIENNEYTIGTNTKQLTLENDTTTVTIRVKVDDNIKEYTLYIYREQEIEITPKIDMLMVNSTVIVPETNGLTYIAYLPSSETEATIRAIAKEITTKIKISDNEEETGDSQKTVQLTSNENTFKVTLTDIDENAIEYTVIIRKAEADVSIDEIYVLKDDNQINAQLKENGSYMVKVPGNYENVDVTAITGYAKSKVQVADTGIYVVNKDTQNVLLENDETIVNIKVQSEDEINEIEYTLKIIKMSNNTKLSKVEIDGQEATLGDDGNYYYILQNAVNNVSVKAVTDAVAPIKTWIKIENSGYSLYEITKQVYITAKETEVPIKVKAEDGTIKEYKLIIKGLSDDANIDKVMINGKQATYAEGKNRYEIRSEETEFNIEVTLSDLLASMMLGDNERAIGKDSITITKQGSETIVKVTVTSQNGLEIQEYTIAILEKSNNTNLDTLKVNGVIVNPDLEGNYKTTIKHDTKLIKVEALAEDEYATTTINGVTNDIYTATYTENVVEGQTIYTYTIAIVAEDGTTKEYNLKVEQLEGNTNVTSILVGKEEISLEETTIKEDGSYYYKIERVENAYVKVNLESSKSTAKVKGKTGEIVNIELTDEKNTITIEVIAEDGTTREVILIIEKKSNDTTIKSITSTEEINVEKNGDNYIVYCDENITDLNLTIETNNTLASLKLTDEETYELNTITRKINIEEDMIAINVIAESGEEDTYTISFVKVADLTIKEVDINSIEVPYKDNKYYSVIDVMNSVSIKITTNNELQTIQLLRGENIIATGTGTLETNLTLTEEIENLTIKIISHTGIDEKAETLMIRQKSQDNSILYVKVDNFGTILVDDTSYSSTVAGKDKYPVEIKTKDENALVRIEDLDGNILIGNQTGLLEGNLAVSDGETKEFTVIVTSENGEEKEYKLSIQRVSSNLEIESITVTDYDEDETTIITKNVVNYNTATKIYKIVVNKNINTSEITVNTVSSFTNIVLDNNVTGKEIVTTSKTLKGLGITEVKIDLTAADGSQDTKYLQIIQLSDEIGIKTVEVDGNEIAPNDAGNYETIVTDEFDLSKIKVTLPVDTSTVSINGKTAQLQTSTVNVSKAKNRQLEIPILVTAESGVSFTYTLKLNIISHDTSVNAVNIDGITSNCVDEKYVTYFDRNATQVNIEIIAGVKYSTISRIMEDLAEVSNIEKLSFIMQTQDLTQEIYETTFKIIAEDGTEKEYTIQLIRKNDDNTIAGVYVDSTELEPLLEHPQYADGTYYIAVTGSTAKVKVKANNELSTVSFAETTARGSLEQTVTLDVDNKITKVPVTITSQQGNTFNTVIYIEKVSDNKNLTSVKVNSELAENAQIDNKFLSYIYDTVNSAKVEITAESEKANIVRITENGETYLDENGLSYQNEGTLTLNITTLEQITTIYFKIIAENGEESPIYTLQIEKMSTDTTLKEIYVNGILVEANGEGKYITNILDTINAPKVKAVTTNGLAYVRIVLGDEKLNINEQTVAMSNNKQTIIPITVRSQSGITKVTYLYINKISTSVALSSVTINDKEADMYNETTNTHRFLVEENEIDFELFILAESDYTTLEYEEQEYGASLKTIVNLDINSQGKTLKIKAKSESGEEQIYTIEIARKSDNTNLDYLKVNDIERYPDIEDGDTYTVMISKLATTTLIEVKTNYEYANIRLGDNTLATGIDKGELDCSDLTQDRIVVPVVVTAADGVTIKTYNIVLLRGSNNTQIELEVNEKTLEQDEDGNYSIKLPETIENIKIKATALNEGITGIYASVDINITGIYETPSKQINILKEIYEGKEEIKIPIQIVAEDGTLRENILTIEFLKGTYISGKILTENVNEKHNSTITVYKTSDIRKIGDKLDPREEIAKVETLEDGTFKVMIYATDPDNITDENSNGIPDELEETYDVVVTKDGYLTYTVTNIEVVELEETIIEEYKLLAGDVVKTGEIEIDDLTDLNDNIGVVITEDNKETKEIFDLNEDGVVDKLDRDILKKNYGKTEETVEWVNPNAIALMSLRNENQDFILPIACEYVITSEYGYRVHPITGITKFHSGMDIVGEHHTEVLAVADGEITYAGVQSGYGNCVEIKHIVNGETIYSFYAHLSEINVKVGQKVTQGETIGLEGGASTDPNPGTSTGHHLHFELRSATGSGNSINPHNYIEI